MNFDLKIKMRAGAEPLVELAKLAESRSQDGNWVCLIPWQECLIVDCIV
jgi:hypothetical protein